MKEKKEEAVKQNAWSGYRKQGEGGRVQEAGGNDRVQEEGERWQGVRRQGVARQGTRGRGNIAGFPEAVGREAGLKREREDSRVSGGREEVRGEEVQQRRGKVAGCRIQGAGAEMQESGRGGRAQEAKKRRQEPGSKRHGARVRVQGTEWKRIRQKAGCKRQGKGGSAVGSVGRNQ